MNIFQVSKESNTFIFEITSGNKCRGLTASIALALSISELFPATAGAVEAACEEDLLVKLDIVNRYVPVNISVVRDLFTKLMRWRAQVAAPGSMSGIVMNETGLTDLFGMRVFFDEATLQTIAQCGSDIATFKRGFSLLLSDLETKA